MTPPLPLPLSPLPSLVTSATRIYDFLQKVAARSREGKTDPQTHRQREMTGGREGGGREGEVKQSSSSSVLARNVKQFS